MRRVKGRGRFVWRLAWIGIFLGACARQEPVLVARPTAHVPPLPAPPRLPAPPEWAHWVAVDVPIRGSVHGPDMPLTEGQIVRIERAEERWNAAPEAARDRLKKQGFVVIQSGKQTRLGEYYAALQEQGVPFVVTLDALFALTHLALDRALAEVDRALVPALALVLARLDQRLAAEARGATADLVPAYAVARGVIAVARAVMSPAYVPAQDIAPNVRADAGRVIAHEGPAESAVLGVTFDYSAMAPRGALDVNAAAQLGPYRALAWLAEAPLMLAASAEVVGSPLDVERARVHTRAALLIARLLSADTEPEAAHAWERIASTLRFVSGAADDLTPPEIAALAAKVGLDMRDANAIANVARIDRVRHAAIDGHAPGVYDGAGGLRAGVSEGDGGAAMSGAFGRGALSMRLFGPAAAPDAQVLQALVFPAVGALLTPRDGGPLSVTTRDRKRTMPAALDIAAWLGSADARTLLHESGDDAYEGFDVALDALYRHRPREELRHASLHMSMLDAIATYLAGSAADAGQPAALGSQWRRRKLEVALGAWSTLRHDDEAFTRVASSPAVLGSRAAASRVPGFVEAHPEAIGRLLSLVRQARDGLAVGGIAAGSPAGIVVDEVDALLALSLRVALDEANDDALTGEDVTAMSALPARLAALDTFVAPTRGGEIPLVCDVHVDLAAGRVLQEATGSIDDLYLVVREPATGRMLLTVGASVPHYELVQPSGARLLDEEWRTRLRASPPPRHAFVGGYLVGPAE